MQVAGYWFYFFANNNALYKDILDMAGKTLPELVQNLNKIHVHVRAVFPPNIKTPAIWASDITNDSMVVHCI
jgi:hypothetical protein